jgi:hypothetical protein
MSAPKYEHGKAVRWFGRYLLGTQDKGCIMRPTDDSFDVYVDADFAGNWDPTTASNDIDTAWSRHGYIIMYAGCPVVWQSKMPTEIALSSTESEYVGLSYSLRTTLHMMALLKEMQQFKLPVPATTPTI